MKYTLFIHVAILAAIITLGTMVFLTNTQRTTNRFFLALSLTLSLWLGFLALGFNTFDPDMVEWAIRVSSATAAFIPVLFDCLRASVLHPDDKARSVLNRDGLWIILSAAISLLSHTSFYLTGTRLPEGGIAGSSILEPVYGPGFLLYGAFFVGSLGLLTFRFVRDARSSFGIQRVELQFTQLACITSILTGVTMAIVLPAVTGTSQSIQFVPMSVFLIVSIIAYGIATKRIMDVAHVFRLGVSYALLTVYLVFIYGAVFFTSQFILYRLFGSGHNLPHLLAGIAMAFSMAPAHGRMQRFANKLFVNVQNLDVSLAIERANSVLQSITTMDALLEHFSDVVAQAFGTDRVTILLAAEGGGYVQSFPKAQGSEGLALRGDDALVGHLREERQPVVRDILRRMRQSTSIAEVSARLRKLDTSAAVGIHSKTGMDGVMLLGPRLSGRIYGTHEQQALQILCNQLAVAIENAKLYTQVQDSAIYNNILLDNLVSGVIAANAEKHITVFNREAQSITGLDAKAVIGRDISILPHPLDEALLATFETGMGPRDHEAQLEVRDAQEAFSIRLGSALFGSHSGNVLGALLVFNDVTTVKKLEQQVRRTDRLASLGTLSAGMAHEIKNPLVTLKTFTQLLPERYDDPDFRETFSSLLGQEVKRIDSLVNQLLRFARPTKPSLLPMHLHEAIEHVLKLVSQQLRQRNITLHKQLNAGTDMILGDSDLLVQSFLNFFLNAIEAMDDHGEFTVATEILDLPMPQLNLWGQRVTETHIRVSIQDTGKGIKPEDVSHVFDPFFTTKSTGTGLGLSVAHGIISEHHGSIDVESMVGVGTTFFIFFPLARKEASV